MTIDEMTVDEMTVDEMIVDEMTRWYDKRINYSEWNNFGQNDCIKRTIDKMKKWL